MGNDSGGKVDTQKQQYRQVTDSNKVWGDCGSNDQWGKCGSGKERGDEKKLEVMGGIWRGGEYKRSNFGKGSSRVGSG